MDENFSIQKCPNCNGYGTIGRDRLICPTCKGKGIIIIDNMTGKLIINDNDDRKQQLDKTIQEI